MSIRKTVDTPHGLTATNAEHVVDKVTITQDGGMVRWIVRARIPGHRDFDIWWEQADDLPEAKALIAALYARMASAGRLAGGTITERIKDR